MEREQAIKLFWVKMGELKRDSEAAHAYLQSLGLRYPYLSSLCAAQLQYVLKSLGCDVFVKEDPLAYKLQKTVEGIMDWDSVTTLIRNRFNSRMHVENTEKLYSFYHLPHRKKWAVLSVCEEIVRKQQRIPKSIFK